MSVMSLKMQDLKFQNDNLIPFEFLALLHKSKTYVTMPILEVVKWGG